MVVSRMRLVMCVAAILLASSTIAAAAGKAQRAGAASAQVIQPRQHGASHSKPYVGGKLAEESAPAPAPADSETYTGSVYSMYMGLLILFGIMWTIYFFLYTWQYDSMGNYSFFLSSFIVLIVLISLGLSRYFTASILTAILWSVIFISISGSGFMAMSGITSPDRFEGDKSNMGRTKLE